MRFLAYIIILTFAVSALAQEKDTIGSSDKAETTKEHLNSSQIEKQKKPEPSEVESTAKVLEKEESSTDKSHAEALSTDESTKEDTVADDTVLKSAIPKELMPEFALQVTPSEAMLGEAVVWRLTVKRKKDVSVHLEGGTSFGGLELKSRDKSESPLGGDMIMETLSVSLVGFEPEDVTIPAQKITIVDSQGRVSEFMTEKSFVVIKSLLGNEPEPKLKEDEGQGEVVMEKDYLLLWIMGIIAAIGIVAVLTLLGRRLWAMRKPKSLPPPPPPRPAEEIAFEKLDALKRSNLLAEGEIKEYHIRLSETVREYVGNRFNFDSLEMSSEELIQTVRRLNLPSTEYQLIIDFLAETDLVKFAKVLPTLQESEDLLKHAYGFVERTTPKIATTENIQSKTVSVENKENAHE